MTVDERTTYSFRRKITVRHSTARVEKRFRSNQGWPGLHTRNESTVLDFRSIATTDCHHQLADLLTVSQVPRGLGYLGTWSINDLTTSVNPPAKVFTAPLSL